MLVTAPTVSEAETQPPCLDAGTPSPGLRVAGRGPGREGQDNLEDGFGNRKTVPCEKRVCFINRNDTTDVFVAQTAVKKNPRQCLCSVGLDLVGAKAAEQLMLRMQAQGKAVSAPRTQTRIDAGPLAAGVDAINCTSYQRKEEKGENGRGRDWSELPQARSNSAALPPRGATVSPSPARRPCGPHHDPPAPLCREK